MATKRAKQVRRTVTEEVVDGDDTATESNEEKLDDDVVRALTELEGANEIRWQIHRQSQPDPGYCGECTTAELSLLYVAEQYGPGRYQIKGIKPDGTYYKSGRITITKGAKKPDGSTVAAELLAGMKADSGNNQLLIAMMQMQSQVAQASAAAQAQVMSALIGKPDKEFPWKEIIVASPLVLTGLKEFFVSKDDSNDSMERLLKQLTIVEKLRGDDNKGSTWTDILRDALPSLSQLVSRPAAGGQHGAVQSPASRPAAHAPPQLPATGNAIATDSAQPSIETPDAIAPPVEIQAADFFRVKFEELLRNAADDKDPELRAELFLDDLPSYISETMILEMLSAGDWFEKLCLFDVRVSNYRGWFTNLREYLLHAVQNADDDELPIRNDETEPEALRS